MSNDEQERQSRARSFREAAEARRQPLPATEPTPEQLPGESPLHYVERRMREQHEAEQRKKAAGGAGTEKPAKDPSSGG